MKICAEYARHLRRRAPCRCSRWPVRRGTPLRAIWLIGQFHRRDQTAHADGFLDHQRRPVLLLDSKFFSTSIAVARCPQPDRPAGPPPARRVRHLLVDRIGQVTGAFLVLGHDRLQHVEALLAGWSATTFRRPCAALTARSTSAAVPSAIRRTPPRWSGCRRRGMPVRWGRPTGRRCRTSGTRAWVRVCWGYRVSLGSFCIPCAEPVVRAFLQNSPSDRCTCTTPTFPLA